jgi:sodium/hydrogen antiporter
MSTGDVVLIGGAMLGFALVSRRLAGTALTAAIFFVLAGLVIGTKGLDLLEVEVGSSDLRLLAEITLALLLFSDAAGIDTKQLRRQAGFPVRLLAVGLPLTILAGSVTAAAMFPDLVLFEAVALAVLLSPTDAALGQAVVTDRRLPSTVRQGLNVESGLNDGVCVPLLLAAITFAELEEAPSFSGHVVASLIEELLIAGVVGLVVGLGVALLRNRAERAGWMAESWLQLVPLLTTLVAYAVTVDQGGSGFIAAFVAGLVYGRVVGSASHGDKQLTEDLGELLSGVTFLLFGAASVGQAVSGLDVATIVYAVLSLTVIRMLPVAISMFGTGARLPTVAVAGWFGPRGLATIVFALTLVEDSGLQGTQRIVQVAAVTVLLSVLAHGVTAPWFVGRYARWFEAHRADLTFETQEAAAVRPTRSRWAGTPPRPHDED